jgi:hypothetical protein
MEATLLLLILFFLGMTFVTRLSWLLLMDSIGGLIIHNKIVTDIWQKCHGLTQKNKESEVIIDEVRLEKKEE